MSRQATIVVVEDNPDHLELFTRILQRDGHHVVALEDAMQALDYLSHNSPDLLLTDINLPGMTGFELLEQVQQIPHLNTMRTVAITANSVASTRATCATAGFSASTNKPVSRSELLSLIHQVLV